MLEIPMLEKPSDKNYLPSQNLLRKLELRKNLRMFEKLPLLKNKELEIKGI